MNVPRFQHLRPQLAMSALIASLGTLSATPPPAPAIEVEVWMVEVPAGVSADFASSLPLPGKFEVSSLDADTWLQSMGGHDNASTHLVLGLSESEEFSIELPKIGCGFHGTGTLADGTVHFQLVSIDNPERPMPDCTLSAPLSPAPAIVPGKASAREATVNVGDRETLVFAPADRGDGLQRLVLWRTVAK